jgi:hypothetical protein
MNRVLWGGLLALGLAALGFLVGGMLAARLLTHPGDGFAGSGTAAAGALAGALAGLILGAALAWRLTLPVLTRSAVLAVLLGGGGLALLLWRGAVRQVEQQAQDNAPPSRIATDATPTTPPALAADGTPILPPLPAPGTPDTLLGLVTVPTDSLAPFETKEHAYEEKAVTVYKRDGNWYLVGTRGGARAWVHTLSTSRFFPLEELVVNRLNWLTEAWDTHLRDTPDLNGPAKEAPVPRAGGQEVPASVLESRTMGGMLWFRVEVYRDSPCETGGKPTVIATGWIPAWGRDGKPTAWFYSRGC